MVVVVVIEVVVKSFVVEVGGEVIVVEIELGVWLEVFG